MGDAITVSPLRLAKLCLVFGGCLFTAVSGNGIGDGFVADRYTGFDATFPLIASVGNGRSSMVIIAEAVRDYLIYEYKSNSSEQL